jgi:DNA repair protein RadC
MERAVSSLADEELIEVLAGAPGSGSGVFEPRASASGPKAGSDWRHSEAKREALRRMAARRTARAAPCLRCSAEAYEAIGASLARRTQERFWVVALDARNRPLSRHLVAQGSLASCMVHPREVFAPLVRRRAAAAILVHNHPSGDPTPSPEDERLTERLVEAGRLLGIPVLDHLVVAREGYYSLRDEGRLPRGSPEPGPEPEPGRQSTI